VALKLRTIPEIVQGIQERMGEIPKNYGYCPECNGKGYKSVLIGEGVLIQYTDCICSTCEGKGVMLLPLAPIDFII